MLIRYLGTHYSDVIMGTMAFQTTGVSIVYSTLCSGAVQRNHQSSASLAFVRGIHPWPVNCPHKGPVTRKMLPFDDVIMCRQVMSSHPMNNPLFVVVMNGVNILRFTHDGNRTEYIRVKIITALKLITEKNGPICWQKRKTRRWSWSWIQRDIVFFHSINLTH